MIVRGDVDGPTVVMEVGSTFVGAPVLKMIVGPNVEGNISSIKGVPGVGTGTVVASNDGPIVLAVVGLIVEDEGEIVKSWKGSPGVGPVVVVGDVAGSASSGVAVGDNVGGS